MDPDVQELIDRARPLLGEMTLARPDMSAATVAAAIRSRSGRTYTGVCAHLSCGLGFCAEVAAVAEMLKARETVINAVVAVCNEGVLAPCGRCREMLVQVDPANFDAKVGLPGGRVATLRELLPDHWMCVPGASGATNAARFSVWRADDNGNRFVVRQHLTQGEAEQLVVEFTARGHKQVYWTESEEQPVR